MASFKRIVLSVLSLLTIGLCAFGVAACGDEGDYSGGNNSGYGSSGQGGFNRTGTEVFAGQEFSVKSESSQSYEWYYFTLENDGYISLDFKHPVITTNKTHWKMELYMEDMSTKYGNDRDLTWEIKGNENLKTPNMGVAAGTYYIKVINGNKLWDGQLIDANVTINYTAATNWEKENNGKAERANEIALNTAYYGTSILTGDWDWYQFTVEQDGYISLDFKHKVVSTDKTRWQLELYMADATTKYGGDSDLYWSVAGNADVITPNMGIAKGTYYVKVIGGRPAYWDTVPVDYSLTVNYTEANNWEKENNGKAETANEIEAGVPCYGTSILTGDWDWYKLTIEKDGYITIDFKHEIISNTKKYWVIELYESDATSLYGQSSSWSVKGTENLATTQIGIKAGTYYIKVIGGRPAYWETQPVDYNIKVDFAGAGNWEAENNNSFSVATEIDFGQTWNGTILSEDDDDWYVFTADSYKYVNLSFNHETLGTSSTCWKVKIYAADATTEIAAIDVKGDEPTSLLSFGLNAGTYYVKVMKGSYNIWQGGYNGSSAPYSFHMDIV